VINSRNNNRTAQHFLGRWRIPKTLAALSLITALGKMVWLEKVNRKASDFMGKSMVSGIFP
jgi:hypothetical protein